MEESLEWFLPLGSLNCTKAQQIEKISHHFKLCPNWSWTSLTGPEGLRTISVTIWRGLRAGSWLLQAYISTYKLPATQFPPQHFSHLHHTFCITANSHVLLRLVISRAWCTHLAISSHCTNLWLKQQRASTAMPAHAASSSLPYHTPRSSP